MRSSKQNFANDKAAKSPRISAFSDQHRVWQHRQSPLEINHKSSQPSIIQDKMGHQEQAPSKPFRFLDLAPELRSKIYTMISTSPQSHIDLSSTYKSPHSHFPYALLLTCSQIYHELRPHYFANNAFAITVLRRNDSWEHLLTPPFLDNRRQIRSLRILIVRWGTKDFFCRSLIPALEDCILNGRLRELDVVIRDQDSGEGDPYLGIIRDHQCLRELKRILRDPYLEKVALKKARFTTVRDGEEGVIWVLDRYEDVNYEPFPQAEQDESSVKVV